MTLRAFVAALVCLLALAATASAYVGGPVDAGYAGTKAGGDTSTSGADKSSLSPSGISVRRAAAKHKHAAQKAKHHRKHRHPHKKVTSVGVGNGSGGGASSGSASGSTSGNSGTGSTGSSGSSGSTGSNGSGNSGSSGNGSGAHKGGANGGGNTSPPPTKTPPAEKTPPVVTPPAEEKAPPVEEAPAVETPTPPAGGSQTSHCFASPHLCGYPDPTNTGVPAGTTLSPSGSITVTQAGTVISGKEVTGTINVVAGNVTIENTKVNQNTTCGPRTTCGNFAIRIDEAASNVTIRNVETSSVAGDTCEHDIRNTGGTVTIEGSYLHACDSNLYAEGPTTMKNSYGIAKIAMSEDHIENVYFNETTFNAIHDTLLNPVEQTAVIFGNSGGGNDVTNCSNHLTLTDSLIGGGGYTLYPCAHAAQVGSSTFDIERNHFVRCASAESYVPSNGTHPCAGGPDTSGYYPKSGSFGLATNYFTTGGIWRGNV
ncbi:MAG TPA: hypothetical protein VGC32_15850, partial [Solirubrobacterales bacterium]